MHPQQSALDRKDAGQPHTHTHLHPARLGFLQTVYARLCCPIAQPSPQPQQLCTRVNAPNPFHLCEITDAREVKWLIWQPSSDCRSNARKFLGLTPKVCCLWGVLYASAQQSTRAEERLRDFSVPSPGHLVPPSSPSSLHILFSLSPHPQLGEHKTKWWRGSRLKAQPMIEGMCHKPTPHHWTPNGPAFWRSGEMWAWRLSGCPAR